MSIVAIVTDLMLIATIVFGVIGWLRPRKTMEMLYLQTVEGRTDGLSEVRGASGALFVAISIAGLFLGQMAVAMVGIAYGGAATGRITAILADKAGSPTILIFFAVEIVFAAWLMADGFGLI